MRGASGWALNVCGKVEIGGPPTPGGQAPGTAHPAPARFGPIISQATTPSTREVIRKASVRMRNLL